MMHQSQCYSSNHERYSLYNYQIRDRTMKPRSKDGRTLLSRHSGSTISGVIKVVKLIISNLVEHQAQLPVAGILLNSYISSKHDS